MLILSAEYTFTEDIMDISEFYCLFTSLSDELKAEFLIYLQYLQDSEDNSKPLPASPVKDFQ